MSSTFHAQNAEAYEQIMGRWSRRMAPFLIDFAGIDVAERVLDLGCGTGSLSLALGERPGIKAVVGVDVAEFYLEFARRRNRDPRIGFAQGDAASLPFAAASFDHALSLLVLQFVPEATRATAELRRVVRPGGTIAAAVWDSYGGSPAHRMFWDTAAALDPEAAKARAHSMSRPVAEEGGLGRLWRQCGLEAIEQRALSVRFEFATFDDYWLPFLSGEGQLGRYLLGMDGVARDHLAVALRDAYLAGRPDGPRSFVAVAWACKGRVPG